MICNKYNNTTQHLQKTTSRRLYNFKFTYLCCSTFFFSIDKLHVGKREGDVGTISHNSPFRALVLKLCFQRDSTSENLTEKLSTGIFFSFTQICLCCRCGCQESITVRFNINFEMFTYMNLKSHYQNFNCLYVL